MNIKKIILFITCAYLLSACAEYKTTKINQKDEKKYFNSSGFVLIYEDSLYQQKIIKKKIDNDKIIVLHDFLKKNTPVKIINPENSKFIDTKIYSNLNYPPIFNAIISNKIAVILGLDINNPFVEIIETKKNKTFVAKESNMFEEEKNVAEKAPIDEVKMDDITKKESKDKKNTSKPKSYILVISDFYYIESANNLKNELVKKTKLNNISIKKINDKKYRLLAGPFENFNALKTTYISLNNLGFESLNIYKK